MPFVVGSPQSSRTFSQSPPELVQGTFQEASLGLSRFPGSHRLGFQSVFARVDWMKLVVQCIPDAELLFDRLQPESSSGVCISASEAETVGAPQISRAPLL